MRRIVWPGGMKLGGIPRGVNWVQSGRGVWTTTFNRLHSQDLSGGTFLTGVVEVGNQLGGQMSKRKGGLRGKHQWHRHILAGWHHHRRTNLNPLPECTLLRCQWGCGCYRARKEWLTSPQGWWSSPDSSKGHQSTMLLLLLLWGRSNPDAGWHSFGGLSDPPQEWPVQRNSLSSCFLSVHLLANPEAVKKEPSLDTELSQEPSAKVSFDPWVGFHSLRC